MRIGESINKNKIPVAIRAIKPNDLQRLREIIKKVGVFNQEEIAIAEEVLRDSLKPAHQQDYHVFVALSADDEVIGYACIGKTPLTQGTFDLYWIVVDPDFQHLGVGRQLLLTTEEYVKSAGGYLLIAETSSLPSYEPARQFYISNGFKEVGRIKGYYKINDDLVLYGKYFS